MFSLNVEADRDIAEFGVAGIIAIVGSLSHGHLNCTSQNIMAGKRGCECLELTVGESITHEVRLQGSPYLGRGWKLQDGLVGGS